MDNDVVNVNALLATFDEVYAPRVVAQVNDWALKIARLQGDYVWHAHHDTDEVFLIKEGALDIELREADGVRRVHLETDDVFVVPRGVEHRPIAPEHAVAYLLEPAATLSTGDYAGDVPAHITSTTGVETG